MKIFEAGEKLWDHTAKAIKILEGAPPERVHLDCNGKPLGYVPMPQLGRCVFDSEPHFLSDWCWRWRVLPETRECEGCGERKPIEEMATVFWLGCETYQCEQCRGGP